MTSNQLIRVQVSLILKDKILSTSLPSTRPGRPIGGPGGGLRPPIRGGWALPPFIPAMQEIKGIYPSQTRAGYLIKGPTLPPPALCAGGKGGNINV